MSRTLQRLLVALTVVLFAGTAGADPLSDVCQRLIGTEVARCVSAANGRFIQPDAVRQCGHLIGSQVTSCVGAIAGKDFTGAEVQSCGSLIGSQVTDCFLRTGRPHVVPQTAPPSGPPSMNDIRYEISVALRQLQGGQDAAAAARLQRLLDRMR